MKKETQIVTASSEEEFNQRIGLWEGQGWTPIPDSFVIAKAGTGTGTSIYTTYGIVIQRNVVEPRDVIDPSTPLDPSIGHAIGCSCNYCR